MIPYSRKDIPGGTFVFSLPQKATGIEDFKDHTPCRMWLPKEEWLYGDNGTPILTPTGKPICKLAYFDQKKIIPMIGIITHCIDAANQLLQKDQPYEIRLAIAMGLDDPTQTFTHELWRIGWMSAPFITRLPKRRGLYKKYGYYLLQKRISQSNQRLDTEESPLESSQFIGNERPKWSNRFKKAL